MYKLCRANNAYFIVNPQGSTVEQHSRRDVAEMRLAHWNHSSPSAPASTAMAMPAPAPAPPIGADNAEILKSRAGDLVKRIRSGQYDDKLAELRTAEDEGASRKVVLRALDRKLLKSK